MNTYLHINMEYGKVDGQTVAHLCEQRCHWRGAQWGKRDWCEIRLLWLLTNLSFLAIYFAGRGMVDGSNKRWDGRKKIVLDSLFSLSFCIHFQVRPLSVHFAYQSVPFWRLLFLVFCIASYVLVFSLNLWALESMWNFASQTGWSRK